MKFAVFTHVPHSIKNSKFYAYSPYVGEMNLWIKNVDTVFLVAPVTKEQPNAIHLPYDHENIQLLEISSFSIKSVVAFLKFLFAFPIICFTIFKTMKKADHLHLRCPGNIGLLACFVQILFPKKSKTAKYAGNWDPNSKQPFSYRLQKWILSNTFLTKNMQVLVYGEWPKQTKNVKAFFTATYSESEKYFLQTKTSEDIISMLFVGTLTAGKRPLYAIRLAEKLIQNGYAIQLKLYGEGDERQILENYIDQNNLGSYVFLMGNKTKDELKKAYQSSHFLLLPSKSEGWPKAVAEAMFWGCVPVTTAVSCTPKMVNFGERGILLQMNLEADAENISQLITDQNAFLEKSKKAMFWSQKFTTDYFAAAIKQLLDND